MKMLLLAFLLPTCCFAKAPAIQALPPVVATVVQSTPIVPPNLSNSAVQVVPVPAAAAPPVWAEELMVNVEKLPVIGPIVSKILLYLGIISAIMTAFVAFILGVLSSISAVSSSAKLVGLVDAIESFKSGKIMYWIKFLSMFNAQKPVVAAVPAQSIPAV